MMKRRRSLSLGRRYGSLFVIFPVVLLALWFIFISASDEDVEQLSVSESYYLSLPMTQASGSNRDFLSRKTGFPQPALEPTSTLTPQKAVGTPTPVADLRVCDVPLLSAVPDVGGELPGDVCAALISDFPERGVVMGSSGGDPAVLYFFALTTGAVESLSYDGNEIDLARVYYLTGDGVLKDDLWTAIGWLDREGIYHPMSTKNPWSRDDGIKLFSERGRGYYFSLLGFNLADQAVSWERCPRWESLMPGGCDIGMEIEMNTRGGTAAFLTDQEIADGWFLFGWDIGKHDFTSVENVAMCGKG